MTGVQFDYLLTFSQHRQYYYPVLKEYTHKEKKILIKKVRGVHNNHNSVKLTLLTYSLDLGGKCAFWKEKQNKLYCTKKMQITFINIEGEL